MAKEPFDIKQNHFRVIAAIILIVFGIYLIIRNMPISSELTYYFFPGVLLLAGFYWLTEFFLTEREGILVPGLLFAVLGLFLIFSRWQVVPPLSSSWPLLLACVGGVLWIHALMERTPSWPMLLLVIIGIGLYISSKPWFSLSKILSYWPILLIVIGISFIFRQNRKKTDSVAQDPDPAIPLDSSEELEKTD